MSRHQEIAEFEAKMIEAQDEASRRVEGFWELAAKSSQGVLAEILYIHLCFQAGALNPMRFT